MDVNKVIEDNMGLIYKVANKIAKSDLDLADELVQSGVIRVIEGLTKRYDPSKSGISSFITREAWGGMQFYLQANSCRTYIPQNIRELKTKLHYREEDKNLLTAEYVSKKYNVGYDVALSALNAFKNNTFLDKLIVDKDGAETNYSEIIPGNSYGEFVDPIVKERLKSLKDRDKIILHLLIEGNSYQEIADKMGISQSRVGQLVKVLRKKLEWMKGGVYACL